MYGYDYDLTLRVHRQTTGGATDELDPPCYPFDTPEQLRGYYSENTMRAYRELVRENNERARTRFHMVPTYIAKDWREEDRARRAGKYERKPCLYRYTSHGSYPLIYVTRCGDVLCGECAFEEIARGEGGGITYDTYLEGPPECCAQCSEEIASAYGDPSADEDEDGDEEST